MAAIKKGIENNILNPISCAGLSPCSKEIFMKIDLTAKPQTPNTINKNGRFFFKILMLFDLCVYQ